MSLVSTSGSVHSHGFCFDYMYLSQLLALRSIPMLKRSKYSLPFYEAFFQALPSIMKSITPQSLDVLYLLISPSYLTSSWSLIPRIMGSMSLR